MKRVTLLLMAVVLLTVSACGGSGSGAGNKSSSLVIQVPTDPGSLDPQASTGAWGRPMMRLAYDTLVAEQDGKVVSELAESWHVTPTQATFKIRDGITCADGAKLTAETVAANFERLKDPNAKIPLTGAFIGSVDYKVSTDKAENTVTLDLPEPFSPLLSNLAFYPGIICQKGLDNPSQLATNSFGTGPFVLTKAQPGQSYQFKSRSGYSWGPNGETSGGAGSPSSLEVRVIDNETTAANLMLSGNIAVGFFNSQGATDRFQTDKFKIMNVPSSATYLQFNFLKAANPAQDINVRRALASSLDAKGMSQIATGSPDQTHNSTALPQASCQSSISSNGLLPYDTSAATKYLEQAGWTRSGDGWTKDGRKLALNVLVTGAAAPNKPIGDYALKAWTDLGIKVNMENVDQKTGLDRRMEGDYDIWVGAWTGVYNPGVIAPFLTSPKSPNAGYMKNDKYAALAKQAFNMNPEDSCAVWAEAQQAINEGVSMVPLYYDATKVVTREGVTVKPYRQYIDPASLRVD